LRISTQEILRRQKRVREVLRSEGADALIVEGRCGIEQRGWMRYLIDYYVPVFAESLVIPLDGPVTFFARNEGNARAAGERGLIDQVICMPPEEAEKQPGRCVGQFLRSNGVSRPALCGEMSRMFTGSLKEALDGMPLMDLTDSMMEVRLVKSQEELAMCREAVKLNESVFAKFLRGVREGRREIEAVAEASCHGQKLDCEDQFWLIGSGPAPRQRSLPLAIQKDHKWEKGDLCSVVIEIAGSGGYYGEITHLISLGEPSEEVKRAFRMLTLARREAEKLIRPGERAGAAAQEVSRCLMDAGYWKNPFTGIMGHGQGLDMSEGPMLAAGSDLLLREGMRINLHPCLTLRNGVGVTACDCYEVTDKGCRRLSALPDDLIVL